MGYAAHWYRRQGLHLHPMLGRHLRCCYATTAYGVGNVGAFGLGAFERGAAVFFARTLARSYVLRSNAPRSVVPLEGVEPSTVRLRVASAASCATTGYGAARRTRTPISSLKRRVRCRYAIAARALGWIRTNTTSGLSRARWAEATRFGLTGYKSGWSRRERLEPPAPRMSCERSSS